MLTIKEALAQLGETMDLDETYIYKFKDKVILDIVTERRLEMLIGYKGSKVTLRLHTFEHPYLLHVEFNTPEGADTNEIIRDVLANGCSPICPIKVTTEVTYEPLNRNDSEELPF